MTQTEVRVERLALEIAEKTKDSNIADGKAPNGIAAAYLYVSSVLLGTKRTSKRRFNRCRSNRSYYQK